MRREKTAKEIIRDILIAIAIILLLAGLLFAGYSIYPKLNKCPEIASDTVLVHDTIEHTIISEVPYYIIKKDTVIITDTLFQEVDTVAILLDYYSIHKYTRMWEDSLLKITLKDEIQENSIYNSELIYKLLKPQQTIINNIDNSKTYNSYLTIGLSFPIKDIKYSSVGLNYINKRWYIGAGYMPEIKSLSFSGGAVLFKFKEKK